MHGLATRTALVLGVAGVAVTLHAQTPTDQLFLAVEPGAIANVADPTLQPGGATVLRQRLARVDLDLLADARVNAGRPGAARAPLRLNLFDDVVLGVEIERTGPTSAGYWLSGRVAGPVPGSPPGTLTLVVNGEIVVGTVRADHEEYRILASAEGRWRFSRSIHRHSRSAPGRSARRRA